MDFDQYEEFDRIREAWASIRIVRSANYSLFTFGTSELPYYLVCESEQGQTSVAIRRGEIRVSRPMIITPDNASPDLENFFDDPQEEAAMRFLLARRADFSNLKFDHRVGSEEIVTSSAEEAADRIGRQLDAQEEDRAAILIAPEVLASLAVLRYAVEQIIRSAPENLNELSERGFLPSS